MSGYLLKNSDNFSQVADIPKTFPSVSDYTNSFVYTLLEETHADLLSNIQGINHSPTAKIVSVQSSEDFKPPEALLYAIILKRRQGSYVPDGGDLIALTDVNGDQEVFIVPVLQQREIYRHLDSANRVYNKDLIVPHGIHSEHVKEKKKGIFSSMMKGSKPQHERET